MEYFSRTAPNLINISVQKNIFEGIPIQTKMRFPKFLNDFFFNTFLPNKFTFIFLILLCILLLYRYICKKEKEEFDMTPAYPLSQPQSQIVYQPSQLPLNLGNGLTYVDTPQYQLPTQTHAFIPPSPETCGYDVQQNFDKQHSNNPTQPYVMPPYS